MAPSADKPGEGMKCSKCGGLMVVQSFFDHFLNFDAWKCVNCGKIIANKEKTIEFDAFSIFYQQHKTNSKS
jgi:DNA-directed RNA polymerase subunit RPC12/RpoP